MRVNDVLTHVDNAEDLPFLNSKLFDVNIRLLKSSSPYRMMITCCELIEKLALTQFEDYKKPHGMSGANVGIPFNIIGIVRNRGQEKEWCHIMINPRILKKYGDLVEVQSNCGSIRLKEPITVKRHKFIDLEWYGMFGNKLRSIGINPDNQSLTINL